MRFTTRGLAVVPGLLALLSSASWAGGIYLEPGIGMAPLQLGRPPPRERTRDVDGWQERQDGVQYKVDTKSKSAVVVLIRCTKPHCATLRSLRVGQPESELWRRLGAPVKTRPGEGSTFYEYDGVGFLTRDRLIAEMYVLPRLRR